MTLRSHNKAVVEPDASAMQAIRDRAKPWTSQGIPTSEYVAMPRDNHSRCIERMLSGHREGAVLVVAVPPGVSLNSRIDGCWTFLHEYVGAGGDRWSCVVLRKCAPIRKTYRFLFPNIWQVGDTYSLFRLFEHLRKTFHAAEFYFDHDVRAIMPEAKVVAPEEARSRAWDGVFNHNPDHSALARSLRWKLHFYPYPFEVAKRMGWVDRNLIPPHDLKPFPVDGDDEQWAQEHVPFEPDSYVAIVPLSGWWPRDWPADRSVRLAQFLDSRGVPVVMLGTRGEPLRIEGYEFERSVDLIGKTTVKQCAAVLKHARLAVIPDTGLLHIAAGYGVPVVAPWGPSVPEKVFVGDVRPVFRKDKGCTRCYGSERFHEDCRGNVDCMKAITTSQVIEAVAKKLDIEIDAKPRVSLCMMVKNEAKMLPGAIESARPLVDEIVVVDTGSTDATREWLGGQPDIKVFEYDVGEFIQSFSEVRNFAFSKATCKYVAWMDGCERFVDAKDLRKLVLKEHYDCYALPVAHANYRYTREKIMPRIFAHFVDRVHEFMPHNGLRDGVTLPALGVIRAAYEKVNRESVESRNIRLLRKQMEEAPDHERMIRWTYYLGKELVDAGRYDEGLPLLAKRFSMTGFLAERFACGMLLCRMYLYEKKDLKRAGIVADAMRRMFPELREGHYCVAEAYYWSTKYEEALPHYLKCLDLARPAKHAMWLWEETYTWLPHDRLSRIYEHMGRMEDAIEQANMLYQLAPANERHWVVERLKSLSGVPTLA